MATYFALLILLMRLILSISAADELTRNEDLLVAIGEMRTANYFTFVMLINMIAPDRIPANITFLMPNDRVLSKITLPENAVFNFLLRHSIPSPLLFDVLNHFPTGSTIPTSSSGFMLRISNNGRRSFYLNNVQLISPNICTSGHSIRCHGINGVLMATEPDHNTTLPPPTCSSTSPQIVSAPTTPSWPSLPTPPADPLITTPTAAPPVDLVVNPQRSGSSHFSISIGLVVSTTTCMMLSLERFQIS
ncbi:PREDICTED: FAS1 domain-containing protein SELMODRAFT_448915-like [Nelumbo nucifera]|uniref:FAS1 domain-containing protein SELMODRAFT_448915-like n=2 Tax=Nelumbo nucifera TaxID=4432 RepID=A0A1U8B712_NELNU|nr:PREDICTED: FAS1 domain-containing protein SELMODRAFT_448915-like [Nelumbo nucifera]DAD36562.1 TPA_asm: hypothetical protein HUJ06_007203 [Nelumbo nucifera]